MSAKPEETSTSPIDEAEAITEAAAEEKTALKDRVVATLKDPVLYKRVGLFVAGVATTAAIFIVTKKGGLEYEPPTVDGDVAEVAEIEDTEEA